MSNGQVAVEAGQVGSPGTVVGVDLPCVGCGYNLRSLPHSGRCPECGEAVLKATLPIPEPGAAAVGLRWMGWSLLLGCSGMMLFLAQIGGPTGMILHALAAAGLFQGADRLSRTAKLTHLRGIGRLASAARFVAFAGVCVQAAITTLLLTGRTLEEAVLMQGLVTDFNSAAGRALQAAALPQVMSVWVCHLLAQRTERTVPARVLAWAKWGILVSGAVLVGGMYYALLADIRVPSIHFAVTVIVIGAAGVIELGLAAAAGTAAILTARALSCKLP